MSTTKDEALVNHPSIASRAIVTIFLLSLVGRIVSGIDLTDEIQYYYQILGLAETGQLFSNDLFIQQVVYILIYPFAKAWVIIFGDTGLILFGRTLLALCLVALFWFSRRRLEALGVEPMIASLAALALSFAVTYHGIFALSYNSVSQMGWVVFIFLCLKRDGVRSFVWALTIVITGLAHPVAGVAQVMIFICLCLLRKNTQHLIRTAATTTIVAAAMALLLLSFSDIQSVKTSLEFSAGFSVGSIFSRLSVLGDIATVVVLMLVAAFAPAPRIFARVLIALLILLMIYFLYWAIGNSLEAMQADRWALSYTSSHVKRWTVLCILALYAARCASTQPPENEWHLRTITLVTLVLFVVLTGTSSNGMLQSIGAFSILLPLSIALLARNADVLTRRWVALSKAPALLAGLIALTFWQVFPYRDFPTFAAGRQFAEFPIARGLLVSDRMTPVITSIADEIGPLTRGRSGTIFSRQPGIYSILEAHPATCMIYTHGTGNAKSEKVLRDCLQTKAPEFILSLQATGTSPVGESVHQVALDTSALHGFQCQTDSIETPRNYPGLASPVTYTFCD